MILDPQRLAKLILQAELSNSEIARECGVYRGTVPKYKSRLKGAGLSLSSIENISDADLLAILSRSNKRQRSTKFDEPDWEDMAQELSKLGATKAYLFEEYEQGVTSSMAYTRFVRDYVSI